MSKYLSKEEFRDLIERHQDGDKSATEILYTRNTDAINKAILKSTDFKPNTPDFEDAYQDLSIEFLKAIDRFNLEENDITPMTYIYTCLSLKSLEVGNKLKSEMNVNKHKINDLNKMLCFASKYMEEYNCAPSIEAMSKELKISVEGIKKLIYINEYQKTLVRLDERAGDGMGTTYATIGSLIPDRNTNIEEKIAIDSLVEECLGYLTKTQRKIVELHYLNGLKQVEVAKKINCTQNYVSKVLNDSIKRIKNRLGDRINEYREQAFN